MSELATLTPDLALRLPVEITQQFHPSDRFMVWMEGDMLILKRIVKPVTSIVEQAPETDSMTLDAINEIVHQVRQQRKVNK